MSRKSNKVDRSARILKRSAVVDYPLEDKPQGNIMNTNTNDTVENTSTPTADATTDTHTTPDDKASPTTDTNAKAPPKVEIKDQSARATALRRNLKYLAIGVGVLAGFGAIAYFCTRKGNAEGAVEAAAGVVEAVANAAEETLGS